MGKEGGPGSDRVGPGSHVQCVVLSACESAKSVSTALNCGLCRKLTAMGVPHVIGMRESLLDRAGVLFARHFCDAIARQERVDVAVQQARMGIIKLLEGDIWRHQEGSGLAEMSLGQWCLPQLLTADPGIPLIDWNFAPVPPEIPEVNQTLATITLPPRFLGRRPELRKLEARLCEGNLRQLLITGPGGQGKTALVPCAARDWFCCLPPAGNYPGGRMMTTCP